MEDDFEVGKHLLVEAFGELLKFYSPYIKLAEGLKIMGYPEFFETLEDKTSPEDMLLVKIGYETFIEALHKAKNVEEVHEALKDSKEWWRRMGL